MEKEDPVIASQPYPAVTTLAYNNVNDEVAEFFSRTSASQEECDNIACSTFGGPVRPVAVQGATSYTVVAGQGGEKIVQFRDRDAQLDMRVLELAGRVHGDVVAGGAAALGWIGNSTGPQLAVYAMDRLPGDNYVLARATLADSPRLQLAAVRSLARSVEKDSYLATSLCFRPTDP